MALVINSSVDIAANTRIDDVLSGFRNAQIDASARRGAAIAIYLTGEAVGIFAEAFVGQRNALERSEVGAANRSPLVPDDLIVDRIPGLPNERIRLSAENTTGGALFIFFRIVIEEL
jgi:hypothetical protein